MNFYKFLIGNLFILILSFTIASPAEGASASLYLSPPSGTYTVGSTFTVRVKVNSGGDTINAAEGTLIFNPDEVSVISISKSGSIFTLWTTEPTFSNAGGDIVFGGGTPTNFTRSSGTIITINFKAKVTTSATVNFSSGSVLAADGKGTNILANMNGGVYTLTPEVVIPPSEEVPPEAEYIPPTIPGAPAAPVISSTTHPEGDKWYSNKNPEFSWKVPQDVTAVKLLIGKIPTAFPTVPYTPPISEKKLEDLPDGTWYFHVQFKNQYGWGGVIHRKILIDTEAPEPFEITVDNGGDPTNPRPVLHFETTDSLSGVEYYGVKIGEGDRVPITAVDIRHNPYRMPLQAPGSHTVIVEAVDKADNSTLATAEVVIESIEKPTITEFPQTVRIGDTLIIKGTSLYPLGQVTVFVKKEGEEAIAKDVNTDKEGNWVFVYDRSLEKGTYQIWAQITDSRGAKSELTDKITIAAVLPTVLKVGEIAIDYLTVVITLVSLIIALILVILFGWRRISLWRRRVRKETREVERALRSGFNTLRKEVEKQIIMLDGKRTLSKREERIRDELKEALEAAEEAIHKEIKDIKEELK